MLNQLNLQVWKAVVEERKSAFSSEHCYATGGGWFADECYLLSPNWEAAFDTIREHYGDSTYRIASLERHVEKLHSGITADLGTKILDDAAGILIVALQTDGAHHKQWYMEQLLVALGYDLDDLHTRYEFERGIPG